MLSPDEGSLLHLPFASVGISRSFAKAAESHGYYTLAEILAIPLTELIKMEWFTSSMWEELTKVKQALASKK